MSTCCSCAPFKQTPWGESVIEFILYMLWDLGLKVGHATRSLAECVRLAKQDITIRTALLEARYIWGDRELFDELRVKFWGEVATGNGHDFVEAKLAERDQRHMQQGESRYRVEPNIKEGKGGLRDLQTLYWIGKYLYHVDDTADLVEHGVFTREEHRTFQKAEAFLWDVRVRLHYLAGRAEERLSFDMQPELARRMGFTDENPRRAPSRTVDARLLPGGEGRGRPHPHLLRRAGGAEPQAQALALPACCRASSSRAPATRISMWRTGGSTRIPACSSATPSTCCASSRWRMPRRWTCIPMRCAPSRARSISSPTRCATIRPPTRCSSKSSPRATIPSARSG